MRQPEYDWNEELGVATCTIFYKDIEFYGQAACHEDDEDMMSELTGLKIAEARATVRYLQHIRDNELQPQLQALYQLYYSMKHSKHFDTKSYPAKMLYHQINSLETQLKETRAQIKALRQGIHDFIQDKEEFAKLVRKKRSLGKKA
jgi:hypothetical protein